VNSILGGNARRDSTLQLRQQSDFVDGFKFLNFSSNAYMHAPGVGEATGWKMDRDCGLHAMPC
jgi:hypothetical protein